MTPPLPGAAPPRAGVPRYLRKPTFGARVFGAGDLRILALPAAGGTSAQFRPLAQALAALGEPVELWAVDPPGHGFWETPPLESVAEAVALYRAELAEVLPGAVLLGASFGGEVAMHLAAALEEAETPARAVILAGTAPPGARGRSAHLARLAGPALWGALAELGGVPVGREPGALERYEAAVRADLSALEASTPLRRPVKAPVLAMAGRDDRLSPAQDLEGWRSHAEALEIAVVPGPHLFLERAADEAAVRMRAFLERARGSATS